MPKAQATFAGSEKVGRVYYLHCTCGWSCTRSTYYEANAAADTHAALAHTPSPLTITRPTW